MASARTTQEFEATAMFDKFSAFAKYCRETSLPGWSYLGRDINPTCKVIWAVFLLGILGLSGWFVHMIARKYFDARTVTTIESTMASLKDVTFPSVYVCSTNQVILIIAGWLKACVHYTCLSGKLVGLVI